MPADLAAFGLDKPTVTRRSPRPPAATCRRSPSARTPPSAARPTCAVGDEPKVLHDPVHARYALNKQAKDLRDKQLLTFKDDDVTRVDILPADGRTVSLIRSGKDKDAWTVEPGD